MGVPGFFAWIHKNYKKKNMITNVNKDLSVDNLFIDTNCLIHPQCFAILAENKELKNIDRLEAKMINQVILYLNEIIETVDPSKLIYIAIDGVAPMAKMFHQRGRRFKSVRDSEVKNSIRKKHGLAEEKLWSNACITPGTLFMEKLSRAIINYINFTKAEKIKKGLKTDRTVMFSSSNTPGEGEHKVLQYIRQNPDLAGNSVVYGLDADLLFLSLASQMKNIYLIRESQELGREINVGPSSKFKYVSIDILKECIIQEIIYRVADEGDEAMEKKIIAHTNNFVNDFIFSCFLLGNDFVPNIVSLSLKSQNNKIENGLDVLFEKYGDIFKEVNEKLDKFKFLVNEDCSIDYKFFNEFCSTLAMLERSFLQQVNDYKRHFRPPPPDASDFEVDIFRQENLMFKIHDPVMLGKDEGDKQRYYKHYYDIEIGSNTGKEEEEEDEKKKKGNEFINKMVKDYLYGLFWISNYYMKDCIDWSWCFPNHHGLFMSDLSECISKMKEEDFDKLFVKGESNNYNKIKPFEQLMMVLPIQLAYLLPVQLKEIMKTDGTIRKFGPKIFDQDMLYKTQLWQAIPMIDMIPLEHVQGLVAGVKLGIDDEKRNKTMKVYVNNM